MPRTYRNPPLVEAACEFRFKSEHPWDWTIPGIIYERIRDKFPVKRQQAGLEITLGPGEGTLVPVPIPPTAINRMQFVREDESALIQLGSNLLAVNQFQPYPEWPKFKRQIMEQLDTYRSVAEPDGFARLGLRYVNRVDIPGAHIELKDYFKALPQVPPELPDTWSAFVMSVNVAYAGPASTLRISVATMPPVSQDRVLVLLDLDLFSEGEEMPNFDQIEEWLESSHTRIEEAFDGSVTERTHAEVFGEVKKAREANG